LALDQRLGRLSELILKLINLIAPLLIQKATLNIARHLRDGHCRNGKHRAEDRPANVRDCASGHRRKYNYLYSTY
jgi:hypothetical protein